jgi:hypothetical protein
MPSSSANKKMAEQVSHVESSVRMFKHMITPSFDASKASQNEWRGINV